MYCEVRDYGEYGSNCDDDSSDDDHGSNSNSNSDGMVMVIVMQAVMSLTVIPYCRRYKRIDRRGETKQDMTMAHAANLFGCIRDRFLINLEPTESASTGGALLFLSLSTLLHGILDLKMLST
jgi:hypothetical protein